MLQTLRVPPRGGESDGSAPCFGRVYAPLLTRTEDGQGVGGGGERDAQLATAPSLTQGCRGVTAAGGTSQATACLFGGSAGEAVEAALAFLTSRALAAQKEEEEEEVQKHAQVRKLEERRRVAEAAGAEAGVCRAPGHSCGAPLDPAGVQDQRACRDPGPRRGWGRSRFFFLSAGEEEEGEEEEKEDETVSGQLLFMMPRRFSLFIFSELLVSGCFVRCHGVA